MAIKSLSIRIDDAVLDKLEAGHVYLAVRPLILDRFTEDRPLHEAMLDLELVLGITHVHGLVNLVIR